MAARRNCCAVRSATGVISSPNSKSQYHEYGADARQRGAGRIRRHPGNPHHRVLGIGGELRQGIERTDQHCDRSELIRVPGQGQQHEQQHVLQTVIAPAQIIELVDQVEKGEQHEERDHDQQRRCVDLARKVLAQNDQRPLLNVGADAHAAIEQRQQQHQHGDMHRPPANMERQPALRHPRLAYADQVAVHHIREQGEHQVGRTAGARIDKSKRDGEQGQVERRQRQADAPQQFGQIALMRDRPAAFAWTARAPEPARPWLRASRCAPHNA